METSIPDLSTTRIVVTGANTGHGKATVQALLTAPEVVVAPPSAAAGQTAAADGDGGGAGAGPAIGAVAAVLVLGGGGVYYLRRQKRSRTQEMQLSPMAQVEKPNAQLALARPGSDKLRLNQPQDPVYNPYEGQKPTLVLSRHAVTKLNGAVVSQLKSLVAAGSISDPQVKTQMEHSLKRVGALAEFLDYQNKLTDQIYARTLSVSKG